MNNSEGKLNKEPTTVIELERNSEIDNKAPYFCTLRSKAFEKVMTRNMIRHSDINNSIMWF